MSAIKTMIGTTVVSLALLGVLAALAAAPEKSPTELYVRTNPPGASVLLDGKEMGTSPGLFQVKPGAHTVVVKLVGHEPKTKHVTIRIGRIKRVILEPQQAPQTVTGFDMDDKLAVAALKRRHAHVETDESGRVRSVVFPDSGMGFPRVGSQVNDALLVHLKTLTQLEELSLSRCSITDAGLVHLGGLTKLKKLNLCGTDVTDAGLKCLENLTVLVELNLVRVEITDAGLAHLRGLAKLESLNLEGTLITYAGLAHLREFGNLESLNLRATNITDAGLAHLEGLAGLNSLDLGETKIGDGALVHLKPLTNLARLDLENTRVGDVGLAHLKELTKLTALRLKDARITDAGLAHLRKLTGLESLELTDTKITGAGLVHLKGLTRLTYLGLQGIQDPDVGMEHLAGLTSLVKLEIEDSQLTDAGLEHLKGLSKLERLDIDNTQVTDAGLQHLKELSELSLLCVSETGVTADGAKKFWQALPYCTIGYGDYIAGQTFPDYEAAEATLNKLGAKYERESQVRILSASFKGTKVTDADLACLEHLPHLRVLDLSDTAITDAGLVHVKGLAKLEELELDGTEVTDAGLVHLKGLGNLRKLRLQGTEVTEQGAKEILQALPIEDYYGPEEPKDRGEKTARGPAVEGVRPRIRTNEFDPAARAAAVAPYLDNNVIALAHIDLTQVDVEALYFEATLFENRGNRAGFSEARVLVERWVAEFTRAGGRELYMIATLTDSQPTSFIIAPVQEGGDHRVVAELLYRLRKDGPGDGLSEIETTERIGDVVFGGRRKALARLKTLKPTPRPELATAFKAAGDTRAQILFFPTEDNRRVLREMLPPIPGELDGGSGTQIADGLRWAAVGIELPPRLSARLVVQSKDAQSAETLKGLVQAYCQLLGRVQDVREAFPVSDELIAPEALTVRGDRLEITLDRHGIYKVLYALSRAGQAGKFTTTSKAKAAPGKKVLLPEADKTSWGPAVEGVQCRVRVEKPTWPQGTLPKLFADLRNQGKRKRQLIALEPGCWQVEIDGQWHQTDSYAPPIENDLPLGPGEQLQDREVRIPADDNISEKLRELRPGKHVLRVAKYLHESREGPGESAKRFRVVSNPIEIEIVAAKTATGDEETAWGPAVEGVQIRLWAEKKTWRVGEDVMLKADIRNQGQLHFRVWPVAASFALEVDGKWHCPRDVPEDDLSPFAPGREYPGIQVQLQKYSTRARDVRDLMEVYTLWPRRPVRGIAVEPGDPGIDAEPADKDEPLELSPGKHTIRLALRTWPKTVGDFEKMKRPLLSKRIEIEVLPADPATVPNTSTETPDAPSEPKRGKTEPLSFGPVIERVVQSWSVTRENIFLDLDSGKLLNCPKDMTLSPKGTEWPLFGKTSAIDVGVGPTRSESVGLFGFGLVVAEIASDRWETITADQIPDLPAERQLVWYGGPIDHGKQPPLTYTFETRQGAMGVLQIVEFTDVPKGLKIRYKLVSGASALPPADRVRTGPTHPQINVPKAVKSPFWSTGHPRSAAEQAVREVISSFVEAVTRNDMAAGAKFLSKRSHQVLEHTREIISAGIKMAEIRFVVAAGGRALVVTDFAPFPDQESKKVLCVVYILVKEGDRWVIEDIDLATANGLSDHIGDLQAEPDQDQSTQPSKKVHLPDADTPAAKVVLDLASGETLEVPNRNRDVTIQFTHLGKGDLLFDRVLACLRGATAMRWDGQRFVPFAAKGQHGDSTAYELPVPPCRLLITTAEKRHFDVTILAISTEKGIDFEYRPADPTVVPDSATTETSPARRYVLAEAHEKGAPSVLDLASGETLAMSKEAFRDLGVFTRLGKGDLMYDNMVHCLRGAKVECLDDTDLDAVTGKMYQDVTSIAPSTIPCRLRITTAEGKRFDVTILPPLSPPRKGMRLEYRPAKAAAVPNTSAETSGTPREPTPEKTEPLSFGPVVERVVNDHAVGKDYLLDLDTGKLYTRPANLRMLEEMHDWARQAGIDASGVLAGEGVLAGSELGAAAIMDDASWEEVTPQTVREALKQPDPRLARHREDAPTMIRLGGRGVSPETVYAFQTREGGVGVLQIPGRGDDPRSVRIRYKLVQETAKPSAAAAK